ncbi:MAG: nucleotidyltransferase family protein [Planctomycetota bacterium]
MKIPLSRTDRTLGALARIDADPGDLGAVDWPRLFRRSMREKTAGITAAVAERLALPLPPNVADAFASVRTRLLAVQVLRARDRDEVSSALRGVPAAFFKGLDLIERAYRVPGVRDMADLDVLVPRDRFTDACESLAARGWRAPVGPERAVAVASGRTVNSLLLLRDERTPVHLHWHFANASLPLPYARVPAEEIFSHAAGRALDAEATYVILCEHAMKHSFSALIHLSDVSAVWTGLRPDPDATLALARRWGLDRPVRYATILASRMLGTPVDGPLACARGLGAEGRILLRCVMRGRRFNGLSVLGFLSMHEGLRAKWGFLRGTIDPSAGDTELFGKRKTAFAAVRRLTRAVRMVAGEAAATSSRRRAR